MDSPDDFGNSSVDSRVAVYLVSWGLTYEACMITTLVTMLITVGLMLVFGPYGDHVG